MLREILQRMKQKKRTHAFPQVDFTVPERFRGRPVLSPKKCNSTCVKCIEACPVSALHKEGEKLKLDLGRCIFCLECAEVCSTGGVAFSQDYRLAISQKEKLIMTDSELVLAKQLEKKMLALFGRSLKLRQVSAAGCNACEADVNVLNTLVFDLGRFGIQFVASPRHADGILVTGPVSKNMELALKKTYEAISSPKIVIATGACAISGGIFRDQAEVLNGVDPIIPVDLYIPGCPPHPITILDGLLRLLGQIDGKKHK